MYLDDLDALLRAGASTLSGELRERQRRFVLARRQADGGFGGRRGASDLYYTDFALRVLTVADAGGADGADAGGAATAVAEALGLGPVAAFAARAGQAPRDVVECFNVLNIARMLGRMDANAPNAPDVKSAAATRLKLAQGARGGYARQPGGMETSAYHTFLGALACEMLEAPFPEPEKAVAEIEKLKRPDGGYADLASGAEGQTNASAAAIAFLVMQGAMTSPDAAAVDFLLGMQAPEGGFKACADAPESDLLSTFTALVTLFALDGMKRVDLGAAVRWIGRLAGEEGGFRAALSDDEPDIEYTYYGLGALALVRAYVGLLKSFNAATQA